MLDFKDTNFSWVGVLLWMIVIFCFSAQPANQSAGLSSKITQVMISIIEKWTPLDITTFLEEGKKELIHHIIRKIAHILLYFVLGFLIANAFRNNEKMEGVTLVFAFLICLFYAFSDEFHQLYVPGRSGQIKDVFIDSGGSFLGIGGYYIIFKFKKKNF